MLKTIKLLNSALLIAKQIDKEFATPYRITPLLRKALKELHKEMKSA